MIRSLPRRAATAAVVLVASAVLVLSSCSDDGSSPSDVAGPTSTGSVPGDRPADELPGDERPALRVDLIGPALDAVEAERGGPQQYFEVNATSALVNVFVADPEAGTVIPYVFVDGELAARDASPAQGATFGRDALDDLDPATVTDQVSADLPDSVQDAFVVEGGADGSVRYSVVVSSLAGGQLLVIVAGDGTVLSVEAVG